MMFDSLESYSAVDPYFSLVYLTWISDLDRELKHDDRLHSSGAPFNQPSQAFTPASHLTLFRENLFVTGVGFLSPITSMKGVTAPISTTSAY